MDSVRKLLLVALMLAARADGLNHLVTFPQPPVVELGSNFTATCVVINTTEVTADDLYWNLSGTTLPRELYSKINSTALSVTFTITSERQEWLLCQCGKTSPDVVLNQGRFMHGIMLVKGYAVEKPENVTCVALQEETFISGTFSCEWNDSGHQTKDIPTTYTLYVKDLMGKTNHSATRDKRAQVFLGTFPDHTNLEIWVEAHNKLGRAESEHLFENAGKFIKTNPPDNVTVMSETTFPTSLLLTWTPPINKNYVRLRYRIRFCPEGAHTWSDVPQVDTSHEINSFRLQNLQPDTVYVSQVSCKNSQQGHGYWSEWSSNATKRTAEDVPKGKPGLWRIISEGENTGKRRVQFMFKEPVLSNGRILMYDMKICCRVNGSTQVESLSFNTSETASKSSHREITVLNEVLIPDAETIRVSVSAVNSAGRSAEASLVVPERGREPPPVEELRVWPHEDKLMVEWRPPNSSKVSEFVVEWVRGGETDWQRESKSTTRTHITGKLQRLVCYTVSVYGVYSGRIGRAASVEAFLEQGAPSEAPSVSLVGVPGRNEANLVWTEVLPERRQGFITNYTVYYRTGTEVKAVTVPGNSSSCTLTSLLPDSTYDIWIKASTVAGSTSGFIHSFTTQKYAPGEIEGIVVAVSLGFLFVFLMTVLLCFYKKDVIKENFWPQIPDPGESTIGTWSPDYPLKAEPPRESCLSGVSVLDVDRCEGRSLFEEEKEGLPLKKDKFLSEEHSSGIGGSSCMSSPRQSVSDSDEGGDMADTTASTVQYSSVVASNGYKGQTPTQPPPTLFSRSESTQPLLDSEENLDTTLQEGSRLSQRCSQSAGGDQDPRLQGVKQGEELHTLDFCPLQEDSENNSPCDDQSAAPTSSYMPQLGESTVSESQLRV
ncbi:interleukin-6 receptor subunit beta isoform X2 [Labrus bergylta]|uniref:interleukin-6 receptor subunit beta isoform X2 n=1 Tax=Labrus bergylta TaxID=56723 RepID=UPI0033132551